jgi:hypothetical protein
VNENCRLIVKRFEEAKSKKFYFFEIQVAAKMESCKSVDFDTCVRKWVNLMMMTIEFEVERNQKKFKKKSAIAMKVYLTHPIPVVALRLVVKMRENEISGELLE